MVSLRPHLTTTYEQEFYDKCLEAAGEAYDDYDYEADDRAFDAARGSVFREVKMSRVVLDIETDSKHTVIWCAVLNDIDTGEVTCHTNATGLKAALDTAEQVIGHNLVAFDKWHLQNLWGFRFR